MTFTDLNSLPAALLGKLKDPDLFVTSGLIAGQWRVAADVKTFCVFEPSSAQILHECTDLGEQDFIDAIDSAENGTRDFFENTTARERGAMLRKFHDLMLSNEEDCTRILPLVARRLLQKLTLLLKVALILSLENGKPVAEATAEIKYAASFVSWFAEEATRSYGDTIPSSYKDAEVLTFNEPVGVCAIITTWNFPAAMITRKIAPALAAGCSVVIKPPRETPFSALALAKLALAAGIPPDCIHVVPTSDRKAALQLATNPKVRKLSFTGSTGVGKMLTKLAAGTMKSVSMELGGNAPFIVFEDADIDQAVAGAMICKFRSSGQTCVVSIPFRSHLYNYSQLYFKVR